MHEGIVLIFIVFIAVMIVVFEKKEFGTLCVKLQIATLIFVMLAAPFMSILTLTKTIPSDSAWLFYLFTLADIIIVAVYLYHIISKAINRPVRESLLCPKCLFYNELPVPIKPKDRCPHCHTAYFETGIFSKNPSPSPSSKEFRSRYEKVSKIRNELKAGSAYDPKAEKWSHEIINATRANKNHRLECPTCGSTWLYKIDCTGKEIYNMAEGFIDRKSGETYRCDSCGYKW